jgi:hypothetical protein
MIKQNHDDCIEHVKVEGYRKKICILTGQNRDDVIQFAKELLEIKHEVPTESTSGS